VLVCRSLVCMRSALCKPKSALMRRRLLIGRSEIIERTQILPCSVRAGATAGGEMKGRMQDANPPQNVCIAFPNFTIVWRKTHA